MHAPATPNFFARPVHIVPRTPGSLGKPSRGAARPVPVEQETEENDEMPQEEDKVFETPVKSVATDAVRAEVSLNVQATGQELMETSRQNVVENPLLLLVRYLPHHQVGSRLEFAKHLFEHLVRRPAIQHSHRLLQQVKRTEVNQPHRWMISNDV